MRLVLLALACGCAVEPSGPDTRSMHIEGGTKVQGDIAVVALETADDRAFCTGVLVSPRVVLTAAHCLAGPAAGFLDHVYFGNGVDQGGDYIQVGRTRVHSDWHTEADVTVDIGAIELLYPGPTSPVGLDYRAPEAGETVRHVGFGLDDSANQTGAGRKREATGRVNEILPTTFKDDSVNGHVCNGDSGGPVFAADDRLLGILVAKVVGADHQACDGAAYSTRVDAMQDFIIWAILNFDPDAPADEPCGAIDQLGTCDGQMLRWCDDDRLQFQDCGAIGRTCGWKDDEIGYDCLNAEQTVDGCGDVTWEGSCGEGVLTYCDGETLHGLDCAQDAQVCGWNADAGYYDCLAQPGCGAVTDAGECDGNVLTYCDQDGNTQSYDCGDLTCEWDASAGWYDCL